MITREELVNLREEYKFGSRVRLIEMDDFASPGVGALGTVISVDDLGSIKVCWDNGRILNVLYKKDKIKKL